MPKHAGKEGEGSEGRAEEEGTARGIEEGRDGGR